MEDYVEQIEDGGSVFVELKNKGVLFVPFKNKGKIRFHLIQGHPTRINSLKLSGMAFKKEKIKFYRHHKIGELVYEMIENH